MDHLPDYLILDFDSTFCRVEALDELFAMSMAAHPETVSEVKKITNAGMAGELPFQDALARRMALLRANQQHISQLVEKLKQEVSRSVAKNRDFLLQHQDRLLVVSSGFREYIEPVVADYGIGADRVHANSFRFDASGQIIGYDADCPLAKTGGKVEVVRGLGLRGRVWVVGDGFTDYEIRQAGLAERFFAFTENVTRPRVLDHADQVVHSFDQIFEPLSEERPTSFPKHKINILLLENIHPQAAQKFEREGFTVEQVSTALGEDELCEKIRRTSVLGLRSKTQLTAKVISEAQRLMAVGAFCIGTNQIDLEACTKKGIAVFNAPYSNTRSVVELAIGEMILLMRGITDKSAGMHTGKWLKSAKDSFEIRGKRLGIVGYGNIGAQLSVLAEALGMEVWYYDLAEKLALGNARKCQTLEEMLPEVDVVTLHVDGRKENDGFFGAKQFEMMKQGAYFLNLSRGFVVDIDALQQATSSGKLAGISVDVFPEEPQNNDQPFSSPLQGLPNTILTPHIGGSTQEAQEDIADFVPSRLMNYINSGDSSGSVNFPNVQLSEVQNGHRLLHIHLNKPGILAKINAIFAEHQINILGQSLKTNEHIGYAITDVDLAYTDETVKALKRIEGTLKFRVLY